MCTLSRWGLVSHRNHAPLRRPPAGCDIRASLYSIGPLPDSEHFGPAVPAPVPAVTSSDFYSECAGNDPAGCVHGTHNPYKPCIDGMVINPSVIHSHKRTLPFMKRLRPKTQTRINTTLTSLEYGTWAKFPPVLESGGI